VVPHVVIINLAVISSSLAVGIVVVLLRESEGVSEGVREREREREREEREGKGESHTNVSHISLHFSSPSYTFLLLYISSTSSFA
jgi:hypothetical protein